MSVIPAKLDDIISYADFSQEVPLREILAQDLLENSPDDDLLHDVLYGDSPINETEVHVVSSGEFTISRFLLHYLKYYLWRSQNDDGGGGVINNEEK
jgi:hypothetical protein